MVILKIVLLFSAGILVGMFVNYLADVLPWRRKIVKPYCLHCEKDIRFPVYFFWPRKCNNCHKARSYRVWIVEIIMGIIMVWLWDNHPQKLGFFGSVILIGYFGLVTIIDLEHRLILHPVSLFGVGIGLIAGVYLHGFVTTILGGITGFGSMLLLYWFGDLVIRILAKIRGEIVDDVALGFGDVTLSGVLGLMLGFPGIVLGLFLAIMVGGLVSLVYLVVMVSIRKYKMFTALPYGPFLIAGAVALLFFSDFLAKIFD